MHLITEILPLEEKVESVVQVLRRRDRLSGAMKGGERKWRGKVVSVSNLRRELAWMDTHNPILAPTDSRKPQACCLALSSWDVDNFPRCFSESLTTSYGVKYGR